MTPRNPAHGRSVRARRALLGLALAAVAVAAVLALPRLHSRSTPLTPSPSASTSVEADAGRDGLGQAVGFQSRARLVEHFHKHGGEFGARTPASYLRMAQALRDRPAGGDLLEIARPDGVITRFDRSTGAFLAFEPDGTIRTFFKPNRGEAYFRDQVSEAHP